MAHEVTDARFETEVLKASEPVLVDFWAPWCGPCRMVGPIVEEIGRRYSGRIKVLKLNVDDNQETAMAYQVHSIPTLLIFHQGRVVDGVIGAVPAKELEKRLDEVLAADGAGR